MGEHLTKFPIIRYQEKTLRFCVKPTHGKKPFRAFLDQLEYRSSTLVILSRAEVSARFIQQDRQRTRRPKIPTGTFNLLFPRIDKDSDVGHDLSIDLNFPQTDQIFTSPAGTKAPRSQDLVKALSYFAFFTRNHLISLISPYKEM
jgi:hypothetical protein